MTSNGWDALPWSLLPQWPGASPTAPQRLDQPILPGWNFGPVVNVTRENSSAPGTEAAVLHSYSYGRQLGQIADALQVLVDERAEAGGARDEALDKFAAMKAGIDRVKADAAVARVEQLRHDLETLRHRDRSAYRELCAEVRRAVDVPRRDQEETPAGDDRGA